MQIAFSVMSFQISRHQKRSTAHPFFQKGWGTLVLSPHGELRKWYPLLMPLLQAEKSGESKAPPARIALGVHVGFAVYDGSEAYNACMAD